MMNYLSIFNNRRLTTRYNDSNNKMANCNGSLNDSQLNTVLIVTGSVGLVSFISCLLILILLFYLKLHKWFIYRLAMYQVISSMMVSAVDVLVITQGSYVLDYSTSLYNSMCLATGFLMEYTIWVNLLATSCLILHLFLMVVCLQDFKYLEKIYILVSVGFPFLICWIPFVGGHYGPAGAWCWITSKNSDCEKDEVGKIEQLALWYVLCNISLVLCIVATVIASIILIRQGMKKGEGVTNDDQIAIQTQRQTKKALLEVAPLLAYPVIFFLLIAAATANRIHSAVTNEPPHFAVYIVHVVTFGLWGTGSSIVLLVHITVTKCLNKRRTKKSTDVKTTRTGKDNIAVYTACETTSYYNVPRESDIDRLVEGEKEMGVYTLMEEN